MIKAINHTSLEIGNTYRCLDTNPKLVLTWFRCQDVKGMLVSNAVRTLHIWLKTGQGPRESGSVGWGHCGIVSLVGFSSVNITGFWREAWGESWERFTCVATWGMQMVGIAGTLRESISSLPSKKKPLSTWKRTTYISPWSHGRNL